MLGYGPEPELAMGPGYEEELSKTYSTLYLQIPSLSVGKVLDSPSALSTAQE